MASRLKQFGRGLSPTIANSGCEGACEKGGGGADVHQPTELNMVSDGLTTFCNRFIGERSPGDARTLDSRRMQLRNQASRRADASALGAQAFEPTK